jgi:hypothetical protein
MSDSYISVVAGTVYINGEPYELYLNRTLLPADHILVQDHPEFFKRVESPVEEATHVPGERRYTTKREKAKKED